MNNLRIVLAIFSSILFTNIATAGGGWPQPKGKGYVKVSQWWLLSNKHYTDVGAIDPNITTGVFNSSLYLEYGITDKLTVTGYIPFFSRTYTNNLVSQTSGEVLMEGEELNSFGDTDIGFTYGLTKGSINTALSLTFGLPLGVDDGGSQGTLQTGDGEFNQILKVDVGWGYKLLGQNAYANTYVGFNNRSNRFSDEYRFGIESGVNLWGGKLLALVRVVGVLSAKNEPSSATDAGTSIFANNSEHITVMPELNYNINESYGVSVSYGAAVYGRLIFADPSYSVGVFVKF